MFELPTQVSRIVLEVTNIRAIDPINQDDDDTDREIRNEQSQDPCESTLSSEIEEDDLDIQQEVLHLDQARRDKTIRTTKVPLPKKRSRADTVIPRTPLQNRQHPVTAIALPLLERQKSAINISRKSVIVQMLMFPKNGADHNVPQPKAGGDHKVPQHEKATFEVAKQFMQAIVFTKTPSPIISNENYSTVDKASKLAIEAQDHQWALAGAHVCTPSICQLPGGPSLKINPQTREAVSVYSVFCSSIGVMMILNPQTYIVKTQDLHGSRVFRRWSVSNKCT